MHKFSSLIYIAILLLVFTTFQLSSETFHKTLPNEFLAKAEVKNEFINQNLSSEDYVDNAIEVKFKSKLDLNFASMNSIAKYFTIDDRQILQGVSAPFREYKISDDKDEFGINRIIEIRFSESIDPITKSIEFMQHPDVEYATPIFKRKKLEYTPNDPFYDNQYALKNMNISQAWDITKGDLDIIIAIVDSGVDWEHEDLADHIWVNEDEIPNNGIDDDNNGKIDDIRGWDMVGNITVQDYSSGIYREDNNPKNLSSSHGTSCAGCAAAVTDNNTGIAGVAFNATIMPIKCSADNQQLGGGILRGYQAILYAAQNGADVINCSWGGPGGSPSEQDIINTAVNLGSVIVVASGNDGLLNDMIPQYPANYDNVLSVGATGSNSSPVAFSNYGNSVHVYAGGNAVYTTTVGNKYSNQTGTSFSSPYVAGLVALIKSVRPDWTPQQIIKHVRASSTPFSNMNENTRPYYVGMADALRAVKFNNPDYPDYKIPGLITDDIEYGNPIDKIVESGTSNIIIKVKNLLEAGKNVKIDITSLDSYITVSEKTKTYGDIAAGETLDLSLNVTLSDDNPWYQGTAKVLLKYTADEYQDYEIVDLDIQIPTNNRFTGIFSLSPTYQIIWHGASLPTKNINWMVGTSQQIGTLLFRSVNGSPQLTVPSNETAYAIYAFNANKAMIGYSPTNGSSYINLTTNSGSSWTKINTANVTNFINAIHFYDDNEGLLLGDPIQGIWGISRTSNGGQTWQAPSSAPTPQVNETGYVESVCFLNDKVWFGTSTGRLFYSDNRGRSFSVSQNSLGSSVSKIAFSDEQNGFAIYSTGTTENRIYYLAKTTNGGKNWTPSIVNFNSQGISPVALYTVPAENKIAVLDSDNRVFSSGVDLIKWVPVLTQPLISTTYGQAIVEGTSVRVWSAALNGIGYLDYIESSAVDKKSITVINSSTVNFDTMFVDGFRMKRIDYQNNGTLDVNVSDIEIIPGKSTSAEEFSTSTIPPGIIEPFENTYVTVFFSPKTEGNKEAILRLISDSDDGNLDVQLVGYAEGVVSVESNLEALIELFPNPAQDYIELKIDDISIQNVDVYNLTGEIVLRAKTNGINNRIDISKLSPGTYFAIANGSSIRFIKI